MLREGKKTEDDQNVIFQSSCKKVFVNIKKLFKGDLLSNGLPEKVCYVIMLHY